MFTLLLALPGPDTADVLYHRGGGNEQAVEVGLVGDGVIWFNRRLSLYAGAGVRWNWLEEAGGIGPALLRVAPTLNFRVRLTNSPACLYLGVFAGPMAALALVGTDAKLQGHVALGTELRLESSVGAIRPAASLRVEGAPIGPWNLEVDRVVFNPEAATIAVHIGASLGEPPKKPIKGTP